MVVLNSIFAGTKPFFRIGTSVLLLLVSCPKGIAADPSEVTVFGEKYHYDDKVALKSVFDLEQLVSLALTTQPAGANGLKALPIERCPELVTLCWAIVGIGDYSKGSDEVKQAFFEIKERFGFLSVPYWVASEEQRVKATAGSTFVGTDGQAPFPENPLEPQLLYQIVMEAEARITARSGYSFEGYKGPRYFGG